ncbi:hypothetical protein CAJAP_09226 [Camponotus japonicus]
MASEPEKTSKPENEIVNLEDLSNERRNKENIEVEMTSTNPEQKSKQPTACEEDPYIVKLFKSLMKSESQKSSEKKK